MANGINPKDDSEINTTKSDATGSKSGFWGAAIRSSDISVPEEADREVDVKAGEAKEISESVRDADSEAAPAPVAPKRMRRVDETAEAEPAPVAPKRMRHAAETVETDPAPEAPKQGDAPHAKKEPVEKAAPMRSQPQPSTQAQRKAKPTPQAKPNPQAKPAPQAKPSPQSKTAPQSKSAPQAKPKPQVKARPQAKPAAVLDPDIVTYDLPAHDADPETTDTNGRAGLTRILCIVGGVVMLLVVVFAVGVWHFSSHYLPNTRINGLDVSSKTAEAARSALEEETASYVCTVSIDDFSTTIDGADVQIERDEESMAVEAMQKQSPYMWPVAFMGSQDIEVDAKVSFDEDAVQSVLEEAVDAFNEEKISKANASIEYDEETGFYEVVFTGDAHDEMLDGDEAIGTVLADVEAFNRKSNPSSETCVRSATAQDIPSYAECVYIANEVISTDIPILVYGEPVTYAYASTNSMFLSIIDGPELFVDEEQVRAWAEYEVADAVFHMDEWTYYLLDVDTFVEEFTQCLLTGDVEGYEAPTYAQIRTEEETEDDTHEIASNADWDSSMGRYIDVDLGAQFARLFDESGTVIWESAFVSGDVLAGNSTVTGVFAIYSMQSGVELIGLDYDGDGEPDYDSYVNYWMPFYEGYGFHDATWRSDFGGDYYYGDGSHGCVNLPYSKAEELYVMTYVGETVNIHW